MRITNNMLINNMIKYIGNNLTRMDKYQGQLATGKDKGAVRRPGSGSAGIKAAHDVAELSNQRNLKDARSWMDIRNPR